MSESIEGKTILDVNGQKYTITKKLGEGSQGTVYETHLEQFIVKIIPMKHSQRDNWVNRFNWIMKQNIPPTAKLVLPLALLEEPYTGYVMRKVQGHDSLNKFIIAPDNIPLGEWYNSVTGGLRKRIEIARLLSQSYRELHIQGICYCDVSPNNILVTINKKSLVLIDPDNITSTGTFDSSVLGTPRYIAPELYKQARQPSSITDTYSFAVILFELFRLGHPLLGDSILDGDPDLEQNAFSGNSAYIDHPTDNSNRNINILPADAVLTKELQNLFSRMFIDSLQNPMKRPTLYEFSSALQRAEDLLIQCTNTECQAYFFIENEDAFCPWCEEKNEDVLQLQLYLNNTLKDSTFENEKVKIPDKLTGIINLTSQPKALYRRHIEPFVSQDADKPLAVIKKISRDSIIILNNSEEDLFKFNVKTREQTKIKHKEQSQLSSEERLLVKFEKNEKMLKEIFENTTILNYGQLKLL